jgi:hypothetical protein
MFVAWRLAGCAASAVGSGSDSNRAEDYVTHGRASLDQGWYDRAIADFDKAIALNPSLTEVYTNRGAIIT